jgi:lysozyme family protein
VSAFDRAVGFVLRQEGDSFTDDPADHGGPTRYGITAQTLDRARRHPALRPAALPMHPRELTRSQAETIYRVLYWDVVQGDKLPPRTALALMDWTVHSGDRGVRALQAIVCERPEQVDGVVGPQTLTRVWRIVAANGDTDRDLAMRLVQRRAEFLADLVRRSPAQQNWLKGWWLRTLAVAEAVCTGGDA